MSSCAQNLAFDWSGSRAFPNNITELMFNVLPVLNQPFCVEQLQGETVPLLRRMQEAARLNLDKERCIYFVLGQLPITNILECLFVMFFQLCCLSLFLGLQSSSTQTSLLRPRGTKYKMQHQHFNAAHNHCTIASLSSQQSSMVGPTTLSF